MKLKKNLLMTFAAMAAATALIAGCTGGGGGGGEKKAEKSGRAIVTRAAVKTEPALTIDIGKLKKVNFYNITMTPKFDFGRYMVSSFVAQKDAVYVPIRTFKDTDIANMKAKEMAVFRFDMADEKFTGMTKGGIFTHAMNLTYPTKDGAIWRIKEDTKRGYIDKNGYKEVTLDKKISGRNFAFNRATDEAWYVDKTGLNKTSFDPQKGFGEATNVITREKLDEQVGKGSGQIIAADNDYVYVQGKKTLDKTDDKGKKIENNVLYVFKATDGSYVTKMEKDAQERNTYKWTVTANYAIQPQKGSGFDVYNNETGEFLGSCDLKNVSFAQFTAGQGNDLFVFDLKRNGFVRIDL